MSSRLIRLIEKHTWVSAVLPVTILLAVAANILTPLINSDDDIFFMYTLSGGYGEPPSELLHYNYGWHPWLGEGVKSLFVFFPRLNWYSYFLLLLQVMGCTAIFYVLLKRLRLSIACFFFAAFFLFMETRLVLQFNYTAAAFVTAIGGLMLLVHQLSINKGWHINVGVALFLTVLAGMLRMHAVWLSILVFLPLVFFLLQKKQLLVYGSVVTSCLIILFCLNRIQVNYYTKNIKGWQQQEKIRQSLFYAYNREIKQSYDPEVFSDSAERQLFFAGYLYDSVRFSPARVENIAKQVTRKRSFFSKEDTSGLYWLLLDLRIYILLFGGVILLLLLNRQYDVIWKWLLSLLAVIIVHIYLFIFLKMTLVLYFILLIILWLQLALYCNKESVFFIKAAIAKTVSTVFVLFLLGWMVIRVDKEDKLNITNKQRFLCAMGELNRDRNKLFVSTENSLPINYFDIWYLPSDYPASNVLYKERMLTHSYFNTLKRFGVQNLDDAIRQNRNVYLLGSPLPALLVKDSVHEYSPRLANFHCLEVRQLLQRLPK